MNSKLAVIGVIMVLGGPATVFADQDSLEWVQAQIEDALRAAPPTVTAGAKIYAFEEDGERVLVRDGTGPYTCVASGSSSLRVGKPKFPYPDPFCADQNAWAYYEAAWAEANPLNPSKPLPTVPGIVWMLAGMNIAAGGITYGADADSVVGIMGNFGTSDSDAHVQMSPHIMIRPLPINTQETEIPVTFDPTNSEATWVMAAGTTAAHIHFHFTKAMRDALMRIPAE
jgi:hypothetical protein